MNILAISGSLRANSTNSQIVENIAQLFADEIDITIYDGMSRLPHFNPDLDTDVPSKEVGELRNLIRNANGVLICSPEYVFSVPGALKNLLEWTVSSSDFSGKPTALITASGLGEKAHESLFLILKTIEANITVDTALLISGARTKLDKEGKITDGETIESIKSVIKSLVDIVKK